MSPRAAWRLERLGFERAYDFVGGKTAWIERGLPTEGTGPFLLVAGQVLRPATATCRPETRAGRVRAELEPGPDSICAVTNDHAIVVGSQVLRLRFPCIRGPDLRPGISAGVLTLD